jgi:hypothetical protein
MGIVYLLTDFGSRDPYVGILKSRISIINPKSKIIDLSHELIPYDIEYASWFLYYCYKNLENPFIICMVVDPGVGTERKPLIVKIQKSFLILPDNGLVSVLIRDPKFKAKIEYYEILPIKLKEIYLNQLKNYRLEYNISSTFHGRDIFAPATGLISKNPSLLKKFTNKIKYIHLNENVPVPEYVDFNHSKQFKGKIVYYDHFGNLFTNLYFHTFDVNQSKKIRLKIFEGERMILEINSLSKTFGHKESNDFLFYVGSFGFIEIAKNQHSAFLEWNDWERIKRFDVLLEFLG